MKAGVQVLGFRRMRGCNSNLHAYAYVNLKELSGYWDTTELVVSVKVDAEAGSLGTWFVRFR